MKIRPFCPSDLEPLYDIYLSVSALLPHHLMVGLEQFAEELTQAKYKEDEHWDQDAHLILTAERAGYPVAFAHASFLTADARHSDLKAGAGMLRFAFSRPADSDALIALFGHIVETARMRSCHDLRAFAGYAPLFHNSDQSAVSNAWPWVSRALVQQGFETMGWPVLAMYCDLASARLTRLPLPKEAELRYDWTTRIGERDSTEGGYHIFFGEDRAAESMWHFGEKYVRGSGNAHVHLFWLGTNAPYRGQGLGRILLRETLIRAQELGAKGSDLRCNINNFYAHAIYRAENYEPCDLLWAFRHQRLEH